MYSPFPTVLTLHVHNSSAASMLEPIALEHAPSAQMVVLAREERRANMGRGLFLGRSLPYLLSYQHGPVDSGLRTAGILSRLGDNRTLSLSHQHHHPTISLMNFHAPFGLFGLVFNALPGSWWSIRGSLVPVRCIIVYVFVTSG